MKQQKFLTINEFAERFAMSPAKVRRMTESNEIKAIETRRGHLRFLIPEQEVRRYEKDGPRPPEAVEAFGPMLRVSQVAKMTGYTTATIRRMCFDGRLPYTRPSGERGHLRIPREAVEAQLPKK